MEKVILYEIIGYTGSLLVAISLMMNKIVRLRIINMLGAISFIIYGLLIHSVPVASMNIFIVAINLFYLWKIYSADEHFKLIKITHDDEYFRAFLDFHKDDIQSSQPDGIKLIHDCNFIIFILRDMNPAGVIACIINNQGTLTIHLDYVTERFRDFKIGDFLFEKNLNFFKKNGIKIIQSKGIKAKHIKYLKKMNFKEKDDWYQLEVS